MCNLPADDPKPRLLIVDAHLLFREGLASLFWLGSEMEVAAAAPEDAVPTARQFLPNLLLLDAALSAPPVFQLAESLRAAVPDVRLVLLDDTVRPWRVCRALEAQAAGYWTKQASFAQLAAAVGKAAMGQTAFCPEVAPHLVSAGGGLRFDPPQGLPLSALSVREREVFARLAVGRSVAQCAAELGLAANTVENHKTRLMRKLGVHNRVELVRQAMVAGFVDEDGRAPWH
jgi:DNA-binding NarL/FixJ family response regulator